MLRNHKFVVVGEDYYHTLGAIRALGEQGIYPDFIGAKYKTRIASKSRYINCAHLVDSCEEAYEVLLREYSGLEDKPFVITADDDIQEMLDSNYEELRKDFILFNAGKNGRIKRFMDKKEILDLAEKHGFNVLRTVVVERGEIPDDLVYPIITKSISPLVGGWKKDVHICYSDAELAEAYKTIKSPQVLLQRFIEKKNEYCLDGFTVNQGKNMFVPTTTSYNYPIRGYYSPYMTVYPLSNEDIRSKLQNMMEEIGFEGIFSAEFLIDGDGTFYFTEINFRFSTWGYIASTLGMSIPYLWAEATLSGVINDSWYKPIPDHYTAMVEPIDYGKRVIEGHTSLADWLIDFKNAGCTFYLSEKDPEPFYEMVRNWESLS